MRAERERLKELERLENTKFAGKSDEEVMQMEEIVMRHEVPEARATIFISNAAFAKLTEEQIEARRNEIRHLRAVLDRRRKMKEEGSA